MTITWGAPAPAESSVARRSSSPQLAVLRRLVTEVSGREPISTTENIFSAGAAPLHAIRLAGRITTTFGIPVAPVELAGASSVLTIAERIGLDTTGGDVWSSALVLRPGGRSSPLFCVPGASGLGWHYAELLRTARLDRPLHALQSPEFGSVGRAGPPAARERIAEHVRVVLSTQPHGPLYLLGTGSAVPWACETAAQLRKAGRDVRLLAAPPRPPAAERAEDPLQGVLRSLGHVTGELLSSSLDFDRALTLANRAPLAMADIDRPRLLLMAVVYANGVHAAQAMGNDRLGESTSPCADLPADLARLAGTPARFMSAHG